LGSGSVRAPDPNAFRQSALLASRRAIHAPGRPIDSALPSGEGARSWGNHGFPHGH
jgi:hypothetical protein